VAVFIHATVLQRSKPKLGMDEIAAFPFNKTAIRVGCAPNRVLLEGYKLLIRSSSRCHGGGGEVGSEQFLGRSKGDQVRLHLPGSTTFMLKEDFVGDMPKRQ
jgi:hypothetical protein